MNIGVDIRVLARGTRTGVEEYAANLLARLLPLSPEINYQLFYSGFRKACLDYPWLNLKNVRLREFRIPNRPFFVSAKYFNRPKADKLLKGVDVYFNPHFFNAPVSRECRKVMTFHDLSFVRYPEFFSWRKRLWQRFLINAKKEALSADKIIAVSESTKEDLINLFGIKEEKIAVIYSGVGEQFKPSVILSPPEAGEESRRITATAVSDGILRGVYTERSECAQNDKGRRDSEFILSETKDLSQNDILPKRFILYFGTIEPRKNIVGLIRAFELLRDKEIKLVIAGAKGWLCRDIFQAASQSKRNSDIFFTGFVREEDKPRLYNLAELFVYPSFFEGFGFPPLEAMACGVPTIVSNVSSLPEAVGAAAVTINPYDIGEMAWAMETILDDRELRERMKREGIEQARKFDWNKTAQKTLRVLTE